MPVTTLSSVESRFLASEFSVGGEVTCSKPSKLAIAISGMNVFVVSAFVALTHIMRRQLYKHGIIIPYQSDKNYNITSLITCILNILEQLNKHISLVKSSWNYCLINNKKRIVIIFSLSLKSGLKSKGMNILGQTI